MSKSLDGVLVKSAYKKQEFTEQQIEEFAACADPVTGPEYFMRNFFYIQHPVQGKMKYNPWEFQERLIETYHK